MNIKMTTTKEKEKKQSINEIREMNTKKIIAHAFKTPKRRFILLYLCVSNICI